MMPIPGPRPGRPRWPRPPRRTVRLRLTLLYCAAFLVCGVGSAAVLGLTFLLYWVTTHLGSMQPQASGGYETVVVRSSAVRRAGLGLLKIPVVQRIGPYDVLKIPVPQPDLAQAAHANVTIPVLGQITVDRQQALIASAIALAVIVLAAAVIGWLLAGRVLRPLRTITAAARRISASSLHERLALSGPHDELKELADTLDGLFARLEASFDAQRRFAANASHELRTPLTRERALLQVTRADPASTTGTWRAVSEELLASNAEQERLIEALLTLANSEAGPGGHEPVDLAAITGAALADAGPEIGRRGLTVHADIRPAVLDGDPLLLQQMVTNLIDNAVRHNIPGGEIRVATGASGGPAVLSVTNSGQAIPADEVDRLFQPFQRFGPRPARRDGGHGLGLSIVRAIATAHLAAVAARPRPGGGLAIDVTFPASSAPQTGRAPAGLTARG